MEEEILYKFIYFVFGLCMGIFLLSILQTIDEKGNKTKYIKCGIANYNITSGAFEYKPQYKILGE